MGMLLSVPLFLFGVVLIVIALHRRARATARMTPLEAEIRRIIAIDGPIPVDRYMELCLAHPRHGYYVTRDPFGARGDFITAPEVSQMFGELIGAWAAAVWRQMGSPARVQLIELGPGRGTLMADALRAAQALPEFHAALSVHLVEISPALRAAQEKTLANADVPIAWHRGIEEIAGRAGDRDRERIRRCAAGRPVRQGPRRLAYPHGRHRGRPAGVRRGARRRCSGHIAATDARAGRHDPGARVTTGRSRCCRAASRGTAAPRSSSTTAMPRALSATRLQAVRGHKFADPLQPTRAKPISPRKSISPRSPAAAQRQGAAAHGPFTQGEFLRRLGIEQRAARLKANATPQQAADIDAALARLTAPDQMGELFKVLAIADPKLGTLPGFDS